jgi:hypothetical protein
MGSHLNHDELNDILVNIHMNNKKINISTLIYIIISIISIITIYIIIIQIKTFFLH